MQRSFAEKVRRREVEKFDFYGNLPFLRRLQGHRGCPPQVRNMVLKLINVVNKLEKYSTEALETCKLQIIMLREKFGGINQSKKPDKSQEKESSKIRITKSSKPNFDDGPPEISNSPVVQPKRQHFYIRKAKPKQEVNIRSTKSFDKNNDFVCSTPFENNQDKWLYNKNERLAIGDELDTEIKKSIEYELKNENQNNDVTTSLAYQQEVTNETVQESDRNQNLSDPRLSNNNTNLIRHASTEPMGLQARKQNYLDRLKTAKIVTKAITKNDSMDKTDQPRDPRLLANTKAMATNHFHIQNLRKDPRSFGNNNNTQHESILPIAQKKNDEQAIKQAVTGILNLQHDSTDGTDKAHSSIKEYGSKKGQNEPSAVGTEDSSTKHDNTRNADYIRAHSEAKLKERKQSTTKVQNEANSVATKHDNTGKGDYIRAQSETKLKERQQASKKLQNEANSVATAGSSTKDDNTGNTDYIRAKSEATLKEKKKLSKKVQHEAGSVATEGSSTKHDNTENSDYIKPQSEGLSFQNQSSSFSEKNINSKVKPKNQPLQSEQIHEESETDSENYDNLNDGFEVTLEVAKDQRHRNERKRKAPVRKKTGSRRSKRLKEVHAIVKTEINEEIPEIIPTLPEIIPTLPEVIPTLPEIPEETNEVNNVEIDEVKREVIESDIPILNIPVTEEDLSEENEGMLLFRTKDDIFYETHPDLAGMIVKTEDLNEPSEIKLESDLEIKSEISIFQENSIEPDTQNILIKEEPIEVSKAEIEAARLHVENLSFINHYLCFQFHCNNCQFETIDRPNFEEHLIMHNDLQWSGFCSACDAYVIGHDTNLQDEYNHMLKIHVKQTDFIDLNEETDKVPTRPLLKLRCLEGDYLSTKNF